MRAVSEVLDITSTSVVPPVSSLLTWLPPSFAMCDRGVAWLRLGVRLTAAGGRTETEKHLEAALGGSGKQ